MKSKKIKRKYEKKCSAPVESMALIPKSVEVFSFASLTDAERGYLARELSSGIVKWYAVFDNIKRMLSENWSYFQMIFGDAFKPKFILEFSIEVDNFIEVMKAYRFYK